MLLGGISNLYVCEGKPDKVIYLEAAKRTTHLLKTLNRSVSHELIVPITVIKQNAKLMLKTGDKNSWYRSDDSITGTWIQFQDKIYLNFDFPEEDL